MHIQTFINVNFYCRMTGSYDTPNAIKRMTLTADMQFHDRFTRLQSLGNFIVN